METPTLVAAFLAGIALFLSPCIAPLIPAYLVSIAEVRWDELERRGTRRKILTNALAFVLGFSALFILVGTLLGTLSGWLGFRVWINRIGGALVLVLALHLLELIRLPFLDRELHVGSKVKRRGYLGSALMGGAFGLAWSPCTGPILAAILALSASTGAVGQSALLMTVFSAGLAVPFLLAGAFTGQVAAWLRRHRQTMLWVNRAAGIVLIALGVLIFTGRVDAVLGRFFS